MKAISILLSTYNGEKYIKEQLDSLFNQTYKNFEVIVRDDNSKDNSLNILKSYNVEIINSTQNVGASKSFSILLEHALANSSSDYFMFCDQDDIWDKQKIENSVNLIQNMEKEYGNIPLLVHSDLEIVDEMLSTINNSFWQYENINPSYNNFEKLLMQNTVTGCTMMINKELAKLSLNIPKNAIMHDWWIALIASCFGKIDFINESTIKYRQHEKNEIGANKFSIKYVFKKIFNSKNLIEKNISQANSFLLLYEDMLDSNKIRILQEFISIKNKNFFEKRFILIKNKLFKQGITRNIGLFIKI